MEIGDKVERIYGYFNNHFHGYAVHNCLQVLEILGIITEEQRKVLEKVEKNLLRPQLSSMTLTEFVVPEGIPEEPEELLKILTNERRLRRAKQIEPRKIRVEELSETHFQGYVKDYVIIIDLEKKLVIHDCADWAKIGTRLRLCKHLAAFLLHLDRENSVRILQDIVRNKAQWTFRNV